MLKNKRSQKKDRFGVRLACAVLAALMALSGFISIVMVFATTAHAADYPADLKVHIGIRYGATKLDVYSIESISGFTVVSVEDTADRTYPTKELMTSSATRLIVAASKNLVKTGDTYYVTTSDVADIGGYTLQFNRRFSTYAQAAQYLQTYRNRLQDQNVYLAFADGYYRIRVGHYTGEEQALDASEELKKTVSDATTLIAPGATVNLIDPSTGKVIFGYESTSTMYLGLRPQATTNSLLTDGPSGSGTVGYDGTFLYKYATRNGNGVQSSNLLPLEDYIAVVIGSEILPSWSLETHKAMAVAARTYTLANLNKHSYAYGFDLCCTTECQAYKGIGYLRNRSLEATAATEGQILSYGNAAASIYYCSSMGGVTVSASEAFGAGAARPYLQAIQTPWEKYINHSRAFWRVEYSPEELADALRANGYTQIRDAVAEVEVLKYAENSTYVYSMRITDIHGNEVLLSTTQDVRFAIGLNSANFVVGQGSVRYTEEIDTNIVKNPNAAVDNVPKITVRTAWDTVVSAFHRGLTVITSKGITTSSEETISVITAENVADYSGSSVDDGEVVYKIAYAEEEGNFIFIGKGNGHGVGMSQYGAQDMSLAGCVYSEILLTYYPGTEIVPYTELN